MNGVASRDVDGRVDRREADAPRADPDLPGPQVAKNEPAIGVRKQLAIPRRCRDDRVSDGKVAAGDENAADDGGCLGAQRCGQADEGRENDEDAVPQAGHS